jgi:hypothetical protein
MSIIPVTFKDFTIGNEMVYSPLDDINVYHSAVIAIPEIKRRDLQKKCKGCPAQPQIADLTPGILPDSRECLICHPVPGFKRNCAK